MLQRNLIYTGVTRGKRLVVLVGQRKALAIRDQGKPDKAAVVEVAGVA
jgi:exodeoxyribonuclease V alpha subunit